MLYNSLKYIHVLFAALLIGGQLFLMYIFPRIRQLNPPINLTVPRYILLCSLLGILATGVTLVDVASMDYSDFWIKSALIMLSTYIAMIGLSHKFIDNKILWWSSWGVLQVILGLMIFKPEF